MTQSYQSQDAAYEASLDAHPEYLNTAVLDEIRARDFVRLDEKSHVYLDYTGAGLYAASQLQRHTELLATGIFGNPHSHSAPSIAPTSLADSCRHRVLAFFNETQDVYTVVFTANASHALKLVGEAYPFRAGDRLLLTFDNHNSVNGIREFDRARVAQTHYVPVLPPDLRADMTALDGHLHARTRESHGLFAFPAQSNSQACTTRSNGSVRRKRSDGTFCSMQRRSSPLTCLTSVDFTQTSSPSRSTRCSDTQRALAPWSHVRTP